MPSAQSALWITDYDCLHHILSFCELQDLWACSKTCSSLLQAATVVSWKAAQERLEQPSNVRPPFKSWLYHAPHGHEDEVVDYESLRYHGPRVSWMEELTRLNHLFPQSHPAKNLIHEVHSSATAIQQLPDVSLEILGRNFEHIFAKYAMIQKLYRFFTKNLSNWTKNPLFFNGSDSEQIMIGKTREFRTWINVSVEKFWGDILVGCFLERFTDRDIFENALEVQHDDGHDVSDEFVDVEDNSRGDFIEANQRDECQFRILYCKVLRVHIDFLSACSSNIGTYSAKDPFSVGLVRKNSRLELEFLPWILFDWPQLESQSSDLIASVTRENVWFRLLAAEGTWVVIARD